MFDTLIVQFASLVGVAALIAALINVGKAFGLVQDGQAQNVSAFLSLAAFVAFVALKLFAPDVDVEGLDKQAAQLAELALYLLGFFVQMGFPAQVHKWLSYARIPVIGKSYTDEQLEG